MTTLEYVELAARRAAIQFGGDLEPLLKRFADELWKIIKAKRDGKL